MPFRRAERMLFCAWRRPSRRGAGRSGTISKSHLPPVPPAARSPIGGSANPGTGNDVPEQVAAENKASTNRHLGEQGRQGNVKQNTAHQGFQQDR